MSENNKLDDLSKWRAKMLGANGGFSYRFIAALVHNKLLHKVTDREIAQISGFLIRSGSPVSLWRNGKTHQSAAYASAVQKPRRKKHRKKVA